MLGKDYSPLIYTKLHRILQNGVFHMLLAAENANTDTPYSFCMPISIRIQIYWFGKETWLKFELLIDMGLLVYFKKRRR